MEAKAERVNKLQKFTLTVNSLFEDRLKQIVKEKFHELFHCFPITKKLDRLKFRMEDAMLKSFADTFDLLMQHVDFMKFWSLLIIIDPSSSTSAWRPPGNVTDHMRNVRMKLKEDQFKKFVCDALIIDLKINSFKKLIGKKKSLPRHLTSSLEYVDEFKRNYINRAENIGKALASDTLQLCFLDLSTATGSCMK